MAWVGGGACHEERGLVGGVALGMQILQAIVDQGLIQKHTRAGKTVASVTDELNSSLAIIRAQSVCDLVVAECLVCLFLQAGLGLPLSHKLVVVLVVGDGHRVVDVVADGLGLCVELDELLGRGILQLLLLLGELLLLLEQVVRVLLGLLLGTDLLLRGVDLAADLSGGVLSAAVIFPQGDDLVDKLDRGVAAAL